MPFWEDIDSQPSDFPLCDLFKDNFLLGETMAAVWLVLSVYGVILLDDLFAALPMPGLLDAGW